MLPAATAAMQQRKYKNPPKDPLWGVASIEDMEGTSSGSPPGRGEELAKVLQGEGGKKLRASIRRLVGSQETMEDVIQQACESFLRYPQEIREPVAMLRTMATNQALSHLKWRRRHPQIALTDVLGELMAPTWTLESAQAWEQFDERLRGTLESLTEDQIQLVDRHYWQGLNVKQIAEENGMTQGAVKQRVTRLLHRLRMAMLGGGIRRGDLE
jgi:RNA polymerase sigma factor (sigma-70 family)